MPVLHRTSRLDVYEPDLPVLRPGQHPARGELRSVVRAHVLRAATFGDNAFQHPCHASRAQAGVGLQRQTLAGIRIHDAQDAHHPAGRQTVDDEVHRPLLIGSCQTRLNSAIAHQTLALLAPHHQAFLHVQTIDQLHVHLLASTAQQRVQPTIAVARLLPCQLHQLASQLRVAVRPRLVPVARPLHAQQLAGRALAQPVLGGNERNVSS